MALILEIPLKVNTTVLPCSPLPPASGYGSPRRAPTRVSYRLRLSGARRKSPTSTRRSAAATARHMCADPRPQWHPARTFGSRCCAAQSSEHLSLYTCAQGIRPALRAAVAAVSPVLAPSCPRPEWPRVAWALCFMFAVLRERLRRFGHPGDLATLPRYADLRAALVWARRTITASVLARRRGTSCQKRRRAWMRNHHFTDTQQGLRDWEAPMRRGSEAGLRRNWADRRAGASSRLALTPVASPCTALLGACWCKRTSRWHPLR